MGNWTKWFQTFDKRQYQTAWSLKVEKPMRWVLWSAWLSAQMHFLKHGAARAIPSRAQKSPWVKETDTRVWKDKGSWNLKANKGATQRKNSRNQHGGRAFGWIIIRVCIRWNSTTTNKKLPGSDKLNNSQISHKTRRHWNSVFRQSLDTQKGSHLNCRVKLALKKKVTTDLLQHSSNSSLEGTDLSSRIINVSQDKTKLKRQQHNQNIQQCNSHNIWHKTKSY